MRQILATALIPSVLVLAACGARDQRELAPIQATLDAWHTHLAHAHPREACAQLTRELRAGTVSPQQFGHDCEGTVLLLMTSVLSAEQRRLLPEVRVRQAKIGGDRAVVRDEDLDIPPALDSTAYADGEPMVFRRSGGRWRIDELGRPILTLGAP